MVDILSQEVIKNIAADKCGDPELPSGAVTTRMKEGGAGHMTITCKEGYYLMSNSVVLNSVDITCNSGAWNSSQIRCERNIFQELIILS